MYFGEAQELQRPYRNVAVSIRKILLEKCFPALRSTSVRNTAKHSRPRKQRGTPAMNIQGAPVQKKNGHTTRGATMVGPMPAQANTNITHGRARRRHQIPRARTATGQLRAKIATG